MVFSWQEGHRYLEGLESPVTEDDIFVITVNDKTISRFPYSKNEDLFSLCIEIVRDFASAIR